MSNKCSTTICRYGSIVGPGHPCKVSGHIHLQCKHPESIQQEYDRLLLELGGQDIVLNKPLKFRATPHSPDVMIPVIFAQANLDSTYKDAKYTVMQQLRLLVANKHREQRYGLE